jgi:putative aminopeptidase FrvX
MKTITLTDEAFATLMEVVEEARHDLIGALEFEDDEPEALQARLDEVGAMVDEIHANAAPNGG